MSVLGFVGTMYAVSIQQTGFQIREITVPDGTRLFREFKHLGWLRIFFPGE